MRNFERFVEEYTRYVEETGNPIVPARYQVGEYRLGGVASYIRRGQANLSDEEKAKLQEIGFPMGVLRHIKHHSFAEIYDLAVEYSQEHGRGWIPSYAISRNGVAIGRLVREIRCHNRKVTDEQWNRLAELGIFEPNGIMFEQVYEYLLAYQREYHTLQVPQKYQTKDGVKLGKIITSYKCGNRKLTMEQKQKLDAIQFPWQIYRPRLSFAELFSYFQDYFQAYGPGKVKASYVTEDGVKLGNLYYSLKLGRRKLSEEEKKKLEAIGFAF